MELPGDFVGQHDAPAAVRGIVVPGQRGSPRMMVLVLLVALLLLLLSAGEGGGG